MRFKNFSSGRIHVPLQRWTHSKFGGAILTGLPIDAGEITQDFDPDDPITQLMLKAHPELRPVVMATAWERVLAEIL